MKIFGIEFGRVCIAFERQLQTLAVITYFTNRMCLTYVLLIIGMLLLLPDITQFYYFLLLNLAWIIYDRNTCHRGGRPWQPFRRLKFWNYHRDYFPIRLIKTSELHSSKNYIMGYHPHGILSSGTHSSFFTESLNFTKIFPGLTPRLLTVTPFFYFPIFREMGFWAGSCSVSKQSIEWVLSKEGTGNALVLVVGGGAESLEARPGSATLVLKRRKGFIKLALKHGASLVPMFAFGENEIFNQVDNPEGSYLRWLQDKFNKIFGFTFPLFYGRGFFQHSFGLLPFRKKITVVVGKPIHVEIDPQPSEEKVNATHQMYIDGLTELFEEHKVKYGPDLQLEIK